MSTKLSVPLREIRRGGDLDEIQLIDAEGRVLILHAHGIHDDERLRTREAALRLLCPAPHQVGPAPAAIQATL